MCFMMFIYQAWILANFIFNFYTAFIKILCYYTIHILFEWFTVNIAVLATHLYIKKTVKIYFLHL